MKGGQTPKGSKSDLTILNLSYRPCWPLFFWLFTLIVPLQAALPDLTVRDTAAIMRSILDSHVAYKELTAPITRRVVEAFLDELDPHRIYFLKDELDEWLNPSEEKLADWTQEINQGSFSPFVAIMQKMRGAIARHRRLEKEHFQLSKKEDLEKSPFSTEIPWASTPEELSERISWMHKELKEAIDRLEVNSRDKAWLRLEKRKKRIEDEMCSSKDCRYMLTHFLKAFAASLDSHTAYFTPAEAAQFMVQVQQRLFGIGVQLRDDLNGFTIVKVLEGSPAEAAGLKDADRLITIAGEPTFGMELSDGVELIRGEKGSLLKVTVIRANDANKDEELQIDIVRGEVILKEARIQSETIPFADGVIALIGLHAFYQDGTCCSSSDLAEEIRKIASNHNLKGIILDLRNNSGGVLPQAVAVSGLFITRGIVVAIKDSSEKIEYLREVASKAPIEQPLIILVNKGSASAAEIVAGTLQDYGRAVIVGDEHTFGKGTFQTLTLDAKEGPCRINPKGEFKVTRGRYYCVSGKSPQLVGVKPDIVIPGLFLHTEMGERYCKHPLSSDTIPENFRDDLSDLTPRQRAEANTFYRFNLQMRLKTYNRFLPKLQQNSAERIEKNPFYQKFLAYLAEEKPDHDQLTYYLKADPQLSETVNIMRDLVCLLNDSPVD